DLAIPLWRSPSLLPESRALRSPEARRHPKTRCSAIPRPAAPLQPRIFHVRPLPESTRFCPSGVLQLTGFETHRQNGQGQVSNQQSEKTVDIPKGNHTGPGQQPQHIYRQYSEGNRQMRTEFTRCVLISVAAVRFVDLVTTHQAPQQSEGGIQNKHTKQNQPPPEKLGRHPSGLQSHPSKNDTQKTASRIPHEDTRRWEIPGQKTRHSSREQQGSSGHHGNTYQCI